MSSETRSGRCEWCNGPDEGGKTVASSGYWWHRECAEEELPELQAAIDSGEPS
jgi:hypothetical protein